MPLIIDLPPAQETRIRDEAGRTGVSVNELVYQTLAERFPVQEDEDRQALSLIEQWIAGAPTTPDEMEDAAEDLQTFQQAINQTRREAGARILYSEVE